MTFVSQDSIAARPVFPADGKEREGVTAGYA